jgi:hypothetical protein
MIRYPAKCMKPTFFVAASLVFLAPCAVLSQQDPLTPFEKCRLVTPSDLADKKAPKFAAYRVEPRGVSVRPKLDFSSPTARTYRTLLRSEIAKGPNFAGHYRFVVWGCGSSCAMFAVVNLNTGRVIQADGFSSVNTVNFDVDQKFFSNPKRDFGDFDFRRDSRLLVVVGGLDEDEEREGAFYFVLEREQLRLIHSKIVKKNCDNLR